MKKFALIIGVAIGYVLGSRAGRERYEQIARGASALWKSEPVQSAAAKVGTLSRRVAPDPVVSAYDGVAKFVRAVNGKSDNAATKK